MEKLTDELTSSLIDDLRLDGDLDCMLADFPSREINHEFVLMIDKKLVPECDTGDPNHAKKLWITCAATAAAYVYKSVGESVSKPLRVWLSNAASAVILHGLLGELPTSSTRADTKKNTNRENLSIPDSVSDDLCDGYWYYGSWTAKNVASSSEMRGVLKAEMANACVSVMIASVVNYFEENRYTPSGFRKDSYAWRVLGSGIMEKYGLTNESDKTKAMLITGHWVSKLVVFGMATKDRKIRHPIRPVKRIGYKQSLDQMDISKYFNGVPAGFTYTRIAHAIAMRMVRSVCIPYFDNFSELIELRKLYRQIVDDPFHYHLDGEYLTGSPRTTISDTGNKLFGRLISYLSIFESRSELLLYPQLRMNGETREKHYLDYSDRWENILLVILDAISMPTELSLLDSLIKRCSDSNKHRLNDDMLKHCWNHYDVNGQTQEFIRKSFSSK
ncbi:unnamed protein product [Trichobilharzia regenti]|uniref:DUF2236 domain-containing protein n=1 Tax=Trichobilharzia regenti TaxID=157069 RepID=A0A183X4W3_TRIRE|nr:unnamed protein product [Trichobilharzia regenti]VDQ15296.1 unnamed protein product [Trichobilharzia regenti]